MGIQERKEKEKERRRQQIMVAAKRVFSTRGFNRATMEDIAREAELSPGTLYLYFKNKDELYASLSLRVLHYLLIRLEHVKKEKNLTTEEKLKPLTEALYDVYTFDPLTIINMFHLQSSETLKNLSTELMDEIKALSQKALGIITTFFQEGIDEGCFIDRNPVALADILWSLFSGIVLWEESKKIIDERKNFLKPTLDIGFEIFCRGIRAGSQ
ncbi:MAG: TetR/AcrR family transcriptional regulator [Desulfobacterales bacterium]|nr:TetR/AcrR family transcriptional regulator [Desulfobacterales bacterium]